MDFLLSGALARQEALFLLANALFLLASSASYLVEWSMRGYAFLFPKKSATMPEAPSAPESSPEPAIAVLEIPVEEKREMTVETRQELTEIAKLAKTKIARGEFSEARGKIVEGLAIDKFDKDLNCLLASLYERDHDYKKSELVYKDLIVVHDTDPELYMKLGFSLSMQGKYEIAFEIYKKLHSITSGADEAVEMLTNIAYQLGRYEDSADFAKEYLKKHPRNAEMLNILAFSQAHLGEKAEAIKTLNKLRVLDPYNAKIREFSEKLATELELEKNFHTPEA
jgi:Flp pilus assembly protein TadD